MKDIDFDELDRAVSSLLGDVQKDGIEPVKDEAVKKQEPKAEAKSDKHVAVKEPHAKDKSEQAKEHKQGKENRHDKGPSEAPKAAPKEDDQGEEVSVSVETPKLISRRPGRFMDVVLPEVASGEARSAAASVPVYKSSRVIQPISGLISGPAMSDIKPAKKEDEPADEARTDSTEPAHLDLAAAAKDTNERTDNDDTKEEPKKEKVEVEESKADEGESYLDLGMQPFKDWDMDGTTDEVPVAEESKAEQKPEPESKPEPEPKPDGSEPEAKAEAELEPELGLESESSPAAEAETLFLADAKVEKRPLGAFSDKKEEQSIEVISDEKPDEEPKLEIDLDLDLDVEVNEGHATRLTDEPVHDEPSKQQAIEEELKNLPRELDSDIMAVESDSKSDKHEDEKPEEPEKTEEPVRAEPKKPGHGSAMTASSVVSAATAMSIPKQYKEGPDVADNAQHSLFDTEEYHPPINKNAEAHGHRHTVVWVIVAMLLLIAAAAGFGYWLYLQI